MDSTVDLSATNQSAPGTASADEDSLRRAYITPEEFVRLSGLSLSTVRRYLADGRLPKVQPGGHRCRVLIPRNALEHPRHSKDEGGQATTTVNDPETSVATSPLDIGPRDLPGPLPRWRRQAR